MSVLTLLQRGSTTLRGVARAVHRNEKINSSATTDIFGLRRSSRNTDPNKDSVGAGLPSLDWLLGVYLRLLTVLS